MELCISPAVAPVRIQILTPVQRAAAENLISAIGCGNVVVLQGDVGRGKTTILKSVQADLGGLFLGMRDFMLALEAREPFAIEEAWIRLLEASLAEHDLVFLDDMHLIASVVEGYGYPRPNLLNAAITAVMEQAGGNKKVVFAVEEDAPEPIIRRAQAFEIAEFTPGGLRSDLLILSCDSSGFVGL